MTGKIVIRPYSEGDYEIVMREMGDPAMTKYLWTESEEKLKARHERYVNLPKVCNNRMYVIEVDGVPAGGIGFWESEVDGQIEWETGWSVFPEFQGQGIATEATELAMDLARNTNLHRYMYAFPVDENLASNAICRKLGFVFQKPFEGEFPDGKKVTFNIWRLDLLSDATT